MAFQRDIEQCVRAHKELFSLLSGLRCPHVAFISCEPPANLRRRIQHAKKRYKESMKDKHLQNIVNRPCLLKGEELFDSICLHCRSRDVFVTRDCVNCCACSDSQQPCAFCIFIRIICHIGFRGVLCVRRWNCAFDFTFFWKTLHSSFGDLVNETKGLKELVLSVVMETMCFYSKTCSIVGVKKREIMIENGKENDWFFDFTNESSSFNLLENNLTQNDLFDILRQGRPIMTENGIRMDDTCKFGDPMNRGGNDTGVFYPFVFDVVECSPYLSFETCSSTQQRSIPSYQPNKESHDQDIQIILVGKSTSTTSPKATSPSCTPLGDEKGECDPVCSPTVMTMMMDVDSTREEQQMEENTHHEDSEDEDIVKISRKRRIQDEDATSPRKRRKLLPETSSSSSSSPFNLVHKSSPEFNLYSSHTSETEVSQSEWNQTRSIHHVDPELTVNSKDLTDQLFAQSRYVIEKVHIAGAQLARGSDHVANLNAKIGDTSDQITTMHLETLDIFKRLHRL